ncbi:hypothetical protein NBRC116595_36910 [Aliiglaciecola sp. NS0011-25]
MSILSGEDNSVTGDPSQGVSDYKENQVNPKNFLPISITCFAIAGAFLGFYALKPETITMLPEWLQTVSFFSWIPGVVLLLAGFAFLILYGVGLSAQYFLKNCKYFDCRKANEADLLKIYDIATDLYDWNVSPLETMKKWHSHNKTIFWVIEKTIFSDKKKIKSFEGYFCVIPMKEEAVEMFLKGEVTGATMEVGHIVPERRKFTDVYIGGIAAYSNSAKGYAMLGLKQYLSFLMERGVCRVLTRPVTPDGMRVAIHHSFVPLGPNADEGNLYQINNH